MSFMDSYLENQIIYQVNELKQKSCSRYLDIRQLRIKICLDRITNQKIIKYISIFHRFVTTIILNQMFLGDQAIKYVRNAGWIFIQYANFTSNNITKQGVRQLVQCNWRYLKQFKISNNPIGNLGLKHIIKSNWFSITSLDLINIGMTNDGVKLFTKCKWKRLSFLNISKNKITAQSLKYFHQLNCPELDYIFTKEDYNLEQEEYFGSVSIKLNYFDVRLMGIEAKKMPALKLINVIQAQIKRER